MSEKCLAHMRQNANPFQKILAGNEQEALAEVKGMIANE